MELTDEQVLAAAAQGRLVYVESVPGSGKTSVAVERYGYLRYQTGDSRGVLGLTFNRAAVCELYQRVMLRWGKSCITLPHQVMTFDQLYVECLSYLVGCKRVMWPNGSVGSFDVRDSYIGCKGYGQILKGGSIFCATVDKNCHIASIRKTAYRKCNGFKCRSDHQAALKAGAVTHDDIRSILLSVMECNKLEKEIKKWFVANYRALVVDEAYDVNDLDLKIVHLAVEANLSVTIIGDKWQTLYEWRGAKPKELERCLNSAEFECCPLSDSFRFQNSTMSKIASDLRSSSSVELSVVEASQVDVALACRWNQLWSLSCDILPLSFGPLNCGIDALFDLILDTATRSFLDVSSFRRDDAVARLGCGHDFSKEYQDEIVAPIFQALRLGGCDSSLLNSLHQVGQRLGVDVQGERVGGKDFDEKLGRLRRLKARVGGRRRLIPGLTVFQAKGREWDRVGVFLTDKSISMLKTGLDSDKQPCREVYVAITRARKYCGMLLKVQGGCC